MSKYNSCAMYIYTSRFSTDLFVVISYTLILVAMVESKRKECSPQGPCFWDENECNSNVRFTVARCAPGKICDDYVYLKGKSQVCPSGYTLHQTVLCPGERQNYRHFCCKSHRNYTVTGLPYLTPMDFENGEKFPHEAGLNIPLPHNPVKPNVTRSAYQKEGFWPMGQVPYYINNTAPGFTRRQRAEIAKAIKNYKDNTCVKFHHKTSKDTNWISIINDPKVNTDTNCGLSIICGPWGGSQYSSVGPPCANAEWFIHELGHSLCFGHEHQRIDRDTYIYFDPNVCSADSYPLDTSPPYSTQGLEFDFDSIMMYPGCTPGQCFQRQPGYGSGRCGEAGDGTGRLSTLDIIRINKLYNCDCNKYQCE